MKRMVLLLACLAILPLHHPCWRFIPLGGYLGNVYYGDVLPLNASRLSA